MLSKEEIENSIEYKYNKYYNDETYKLTVEEAEYILLEDKGFCEVVNDAAAKVLLNNIKLLESDKQKLIEKLEKDTVNITKTLKDGNHSDYFSKCRLKAYRTKTKEILSILKGENHE